MVVSKNNILLGNVIEEFGKTNIIIRAFIEAKYCEGTPTTLKFTHESWDYIHKEEAKRYPEYKILGWIHTHPDFGIFLSEYDKFIHENFFNGENQVAYVVDPIQNIEGFYFWINGKIERCKGFFLFDKMGVQITVEQENEDELKTQAVVQDKNSPIRTIIMAVMGVATVALLVLCLSLHSICRQEHIATLVCGVIWLIILLTRSLLRFPGLEYVYLFIRFAGDQNNIWLWNKGIITLAGLFLWCTIYWKCKRVD